jgi:hypothetical protein
MNNLSFIVCSNGFGHISRVISVLKEIKRLNPFFPINIFCSEGSKNFATKNLLDYNQSKSINFITDYSKYEPNWTCKNISFQKYLDFRQYLAEDCLLINSKLIVSDNIVTPVGVFDNLILMGSFLWVDILRENGDEALRVVEFEKNLLLTYPTEMLCIKDIVMDSVKELTKPILLPWFAKREENSFGSSESFDKRTAILLTGGGTGLFLGKMIQIVYFLQTYENQQNLFVDGNLFQLKEIETSANLFSFRHEDFSLLRAVICRPGIGIITACIQYNIPLLAIDDLSNDEISHNSLFIENAGLGKRILYLDSCQGDTLFQIQCTLNDDLFLKLCRDNMKSMKSGGSTHAAVHILERLYQ